MITKYFPRADEMTEIGHLLYIIEVMLKGAALRDVPRPAEGLHNHHCARKYKSN